MLGSQLVVSARKKEYDIRTLLSYVAGQKSFSPVFLKFIGKSHVCGVGGRGVGGNILIEI